jgi:hypothetical protein
VRPSSVDRRKNTNIFSISPDHALHSVIGVENLGIPTLQGGVQSKSQSVRQCVTGQYFVLECGGREGGGGVQYIGLDVLFAFMSAAVTDLRLCIQLHVLNAFLVLAKSANVVKPECNQCKH